MLPCTIQLTDPVALLEGWQYTRASLHTPCLRGVTDTHALACCLLRLIKSHLLVSSLEGGPWVPVMSVRHTDTLSTVSTATDTHATYICPN